MRKWLCETALQEALARKDEYVHLLFKNESYKNLPPASVDMMNEYLFEGASENP